VLPGIDDIIKEMRGRVVRAGHALIRNMSRYRLGNHAPTRLVANGDRMANAQLPDTLRVDAEDDTCLNPRSLYYSQYLSAP
jgi:hypothetical protein